MPADRDSSSSSSLAPPPPPRGIKTVTSPPIPNKSPDPAPPSRDVNTYAPQRQTTVSLADALGPRRSISSFSSFTRLNASTAGPLDDLGASITVLAPLNGAIEGLPRKPWEPPAERDATSPGITTHDRANRNIETFVRAHLVGVAPWHEGTRVGTLAGGRDIWWETRDDGVRVVLPDRIEVERVAGRVANGELWILKGVLNYA